MPTTLFISHISEEAELALLLKNAISKDFLGLVKVFVSSDTDSIAAGTNFLTSLAEALKSTSIFLILCSDASIIRPWIHFELGAVWNSGKPIIPICHSGFLPRDLPMPLSIMQAAGTTNRGLEQIYRRIAQSLDCDVPAATERDTLLTKIQAFESKHISKEPKEPIRDLIWERMRRELKDPKFPKGWRSIEQLAVRTGVPEDEALEILSQREEIQFGKSKKTGKRIAKLK